MLDIADNRTSVLPMSVFERWMHTTDVADELGVSPETVRRMIRSQALRASVIVVNGRTIFRIRRSDFDRFRRQYVKDSLSDDWE